MGVVGAGRATHLLEESIKRQLVVIGGVVGQALGTLCSGIEVLLHSAGRCPRVLVHALWVRTSCKTSSKTILLHHTRLD